MAKLKLRSNQDAKYKQSLEFKFQYSDETSNETYLGLTTDDFKTNPFNRYAASQKDLMTNEHQQFMVTHKIDVSKFLQITTNAYQNDFSRNWYKLNDVVFDGSKQKISKVLDKPQDYPNYMAIINGTSDSEANALVLKANNRTYVSKGIQTKLDFHWNLSEIFYTFAPRFKQYNV